MLFFGHPFIKSESFYHISSIDDIIKTPPNSYMYLTFSKENLDIVEHMRLNGIKFALKVGSVLEATYAEALGAGYIIVEPKIEKRCKK